MTLEIVRQVQLAYHDKVPKKDTCAMLSISKLTYYNALKDWRFMLEV